MTSTSDKTSRFKFLSTWAKGWLALFLPGLALTLLATYLHYDPPSWLTFLDYKVYDTLLLARPHPPVGELPVVVDLDEKSLAKVGQWPWPRYMVGYLLGRLKQYGVAAVGMDIVFSEPDQTSPERIKTQLKKFLGQDMDFAGLNPGLRDNDQLLANTLAQGPNVLGYFFTFRPEDNVMGPEAKACALPPARVAISRSASAVGVEPRINQALSVVCPLPELVQAAKWAGFFNSFPDHDNIVRWVPLVIAWKGTAYPSLAVATLMRAFGDKTAILRVERDEYGLQDNTLQLDLGPYGKRVIPLDKNGRMLLDFRGPAKTYPYYSAVDIIEGKIPPEALAGKIVFIGTSVRGLEDIRATPMDQSFVGVEAHTTIADMILSGRYLRHPVESWVLECALVLVLGLGVTIMLILTRSVWVGVASLLAGAAIWMGSQEALNHQDLYISPLSPLLVLGANFTLLTFIKFIREERQKRFIQSAFSHYLSPKVVDEIVSEPDKLTLTGEEKEVSILFCDVRGFTTISEKLTPSQVVALLHAYLTPMTRLIIANSGTLDKFIGDAIMAFWNAPLDVPDHPRLAVSTALAMLDELDRLNVGFREHYGFEIRVGIGLNVGPVRVGNFGSLDLFDYTLIGDNVNLCSRLEGLTKYYHQKLLVTDSMKRGAGDGFLYQEVDRVLVKGKHEPVTIHTVYPLSRADAMADELTRWSQALADYRGGRFQEALTLLEVLEAETGSELYSLYIERCRTLRANPPAEGWNGVFEHTSK
ncbi:adenylate/guanylate cyclase domain-containing protein [Fundidesulfovibrio butyratiphilus]